MNDATTAKKDYTWDELLSIGLDNLRILLSKTADTRIKNIIQLAILYLEYQIYLKNVTEIGLVNEELFNNLIETIKKNHIKLYSAYSVNCIKAPQTEKAIFFTK